MATLTTMLNADEMPQLPVHPDIGKTPTPPSAGSAEELTSVATAIGYAGALVSLTCRNVEELIYLRIWQVRES